MKKLLTLSLIAVSITAMAQTKIGNITISDSEAQAYFLDCYSHPDTARFESEYMMTDRWGDEQNRLIRERNEQKSKDCIERFNWGCPIPRKPSETDYIKYLKRKTK